MSSPIARPTRATSDDLLRQAREWVGEDDTPDALPEPEDACPWQDLHNLDRLAGRAAMRVMTHYLGYTERHEIAYMAIAEAVAEALASGETTDAYDLIALGTRAIADETYRWRRERGEVSERAHAVYWTPERGGDEPHYVVPPRLALREVWAALPERHQQTLLLHAALGNQQAEADHEGLSLSGIQHRILTARKAFYALWFDWEPAPEPTFDRRSTKPLPTHCGRGHEFTPENTRWRKATSGRGKKRACRACDRLAEAKRPQRTR